VDFFIFGSQHELGVSFLKVRASNEVVGVYTFLRLERRYREEEIGTGFKCVADAMSVHYGIG